MDINCRLNFPSIIQITCLSVSVFTTAFFLLCNACLVIPNSCVCNFTLSFCLSSLHLLSTVWDTTFLQHSPPFLLSKHLLYPCGHHSQFHFFHLLSKLLYFFLCRVVVFFIHITSKFITPVIDDTSGSKVLFCREVFGY